MAQEKKVKLKKASTNTPQNQNLTEVKDDNIVVKKDDIIDLDELNTQIDNLSKKITKTNTKPVTAMEVFMSLPDDLLIEMIYKDPEGINVMCMALGIELSNTKFIRDLEA